ncbi:MAG: PD-(D/E)XK nuclease family protein [Deltaproteobacteria bacterium]|nr:PD-(D/E)XK nuclease family protein [Deltaproteobacteria bacterium]
MKIYALTFKDSIIEYIAEKLIDEAKGNYKDYNGNDNNFNNNKNSGNNRLNKDFSKYAVVFPGKRPALYLRKIISDKINSPYYPPIMFSINEFIKFIAEKTRGIRKEVSSIDAVWFLYNITKDIFKIDSNSINANTINTKKINADTIKINAINDDDAISSGFKNINKFEDFFPWGMQLFNVINELDAEAIGNDKLKSVKSYMENIPLNISQFYNNLSVIRENFHNKLYENNLTSPGLDCINALKYLNSNTNNNYINNNNADILSENIINFNNEFEKIFFTGFISLNKTESDIIKTLIKSDAAEFYTQFESLKEEEYLKDHIVSKLIKSLDNPEIEHVFNNKFNNNENYTETVLNFYEGFDSHSELTSSVNIFNENNFDPENSAVVLPDPNTLMPFLYHVINNIDSDYNITMGYSLKRTPFYSLFELISKAQESMITEKDIKEKDLKGKNKSIYKYFAKDYINLLKHPYVKTLYGKETIFAVNCIEKYIAENGYSYITLNSIESITLDHNYNNYNNHNGKVNSNTAELNNAELKSVIQKIHKHFFINFEINKITPEDFSNNVFQIINLVIGKNSNALNYKLAPEFAKKIIEIINIFNNSYFNNEIMNKKSIFRLFKYYVDNEFAAFNGIPLKGLQIMGILETRTLKFNRVIIFDSNEDILPPIKKYDPLLPYTLRKKLEILYYTDYEALYRYYFRRLIFGAREADVVYIKNDKKTRSRFIEEIIWDEEKKAKNLNIENKIKILGFKTDISQNSNLNFEIKKNSLILEIIDNIFKKLSITAIDAYVNCPVQFYYKYIACLAESDTVNEGLESGEIGTFIHGILKEFYENFKKDSCNIKNIKEFDSFDRNHINGNGKDGNGNVKGKVGNGNEIENNENNLDKYIKEKINKIIEEFKINDYTNNKKNKSADNSGNINSNNINNTGISEMYNGDINSNLSNRLKKSTVDFDIGINETDGGDYFLFKEMSKDLLFNFIKYDLKNNCLNEKEWQILELEREIEADFDIEENEKGQNKTIKLFGRIDRIDKFIYKNNQKNGEYYNNYNENNDKENNCSLTESVNTRDEGFNEGVAEDIIIIDYKTGKKAVKPDIDKLLEYCGGKPLSDRSKIKELIKSFQLPVYIYLFKQSTLSAGNNKTSIKDYNNINACLSFISLDTKTDKEKYRQYMFSANNKNINNCNNNDDANITDIMENIILPSLRNIINEILDPKKYFIPDTSDDKICGYCSYSQLCGKNY